VPARQLPCGAGTGPRGSKGLLAPAAVLAGFKAKFVTVLDFVIEVGNFRAVNVERELAGNHVQLVFEHLAVGGAGFDVVLSTSEEPERRAEKRTLSEIRGITILLLPNFGSVEWFWGLRRGLLSIKPPIQGLITAFLPFLD